jgi:hypothetical protein
MHSIALVIAAALCVTSIGSWVIAATQAPHIDARHISIDPLLMMTQTADLAVQDIVDYSAGH